MQTLNSTTPITFPRWETALPIVDVHTVTIVEAVAVTGAPPARSGASIVDEFADDLRQLADA